jgi:hypothetical protein
VDSWRYILAALRSLGKLWPSFRLTSRDWPRSSPSPNTAMNRPALLAAKNPLAEEYAARVKRVIKSGKLTATDVAAATIAAVKADFYVLPYKRIKIAVEIRLNDILDERQRTNTCAN